MKRVVMLTFKESGETELFVNRKAIFNKYNRQDIGITYNGLCNVVRSGETYENRHVIIKETELLDIK